MELIERIYLDKLTVGSVSVVKKYFVILNEVETQVGNIERNTFMDTIEERKILEDMLPEAYFNAIISVWGENKEETII